MYGNRRHQRSPVLGNVWGGQASPFGSSSHALLNNRPANEFPESAARASPGQRPATAGSHHVSQKHGLGWCPYSPWTPYDGLAAVQSDKTRQGLWEESTERDDTLPSGVKISSPEPSQDQTTAMQGRHYCGTGAPLTDLLKSGERWVGHRVGSPSGRFSPGRERGALPDAKETRLSMERHISGKQFVPSPALVRLCTRPKHIDWLPPRHEEKVSNYSTMLAKLNRQEKEHRERRPGDSARDKDEPKAPRLRAGQ